MTHLFPSIEGHLALRQKICDHGYSSLTEREHWQRHAYDYAWRRVVLSDDNSPIDQDRRWYHPDLIARAEIFWRNRLNKPLPQPRPEQTYSEAEIAAKLQAANEAIARIASRFIGSGKKRRNTYDEDRGSIRRVHEALMAQAAE
jgi:hypothetical protein